MSKEAFEQIKEGLEEAIDLINQTPAGSSLLDEIAAKYPDSWFIEQGNPNAGPEGFSG